MLSHEQKLGLEHVLIISLCVCAVAKICGEEKSKGGLSYEVSRLDVHIISVIAFCQHASIAALSKLECENPNCCKASFFWDLYLVLNLCQRTKKLVNLVHNDLQ